MTPAELRVLQAARLARGLARVNATNRFQRAKLAPINVAGLVAALERGDWSLFSRLPFTTKAELLADQAAHPPYGTNLTEPLERYVRLHQTSGSTGRPLRWLDTAESWNWIMSLWDQIYAAVGLEAYDRLFFPFSFGPFLGFWAAFEGAARRGNLVIAGGGMTSVARLRLALENAVTVIVCTPTYALRMAEVARLEGVDLTATPIRALILAGEPGASIPATRARIEDSFAARVFDHSGMTEIGSLGIEFAEYPGRLYLLETDAIAEFLAPGSDAPVAEGDLGELVLTNLGRWASPLIRYRTGDLVRWRRDISPVGHPFVYLDGGILGRADEMFWVRGNSVYPSAVEAIVRSVPGVSEFSLEAVETPAGTELTVTVEPVPSDPAGVDPEIAARVSKAIQDGLHFRADVRVALPGSLPRPEMKARRFTRRSNPS